MKKAFFVAVGLLAILLAGCLTDNNESGLIEINGKVTYVELEGGFWAIKSDDGKTYDPMNLSDEFKKEGLQVVVKAKVRDDMGGIHQVGPIIEIRSIRER